ncbi:hypothetical protein CPB83DRAFT_858144 [Crepidotus variabilis]|uniref:Uncharacterized protein n=1 Tax=Crepidotus variabilis TaxID=179855 RepID=A0A9P6EC29_9AGAR|nr:hypothetical protein CPB83DRAFT_858144 [Crepidotus variabilis]
MLEDLEDVPEVPPSPRQFFVNLYALSDVEQAIPQSEPQFGEYFPLDAGAPVEQLPMPEQISVHLFSLSDVSRLEDARNYGLQWAGESSHYVEEIEEQSPLPEKMVISLYPLPDIKQQPIERDSSDAGSEISPYPQKHLIELHSISISNSLHPHNSHSALPHSQGIQENTLSPARISVDLHPLLALEQSLPTHTADTAARKDQSVATRDVHPLSRSVGLFTSQGTTMPEESFPPIPTTSQATESSTTLRHEDPEEMASSSSGTEVHAKSMEGTTHELNLGQDRKREATNTSESHEAVQEKRLEPQVVPSQEALVTNFQKSTSSKQAERPHDPKALALLNTSKSLLLDDDTTQSIKQRLMQMENDFLDSQLDYHRELEKHLVPPVPGSERVPPQSHLKTKSGKVAVLEWVIARYSARGDQNQTLHQALLSSLGLEFEPSSSILQSGDSAKLET